jgi:ATP-binding cassette, subfamily B, multidrug efflux pump
MSQDNEQHADWGLLLRLINMVRGSSRLIYGVLMLIPIGIGITVLQPYLLKLTIDTAIQANEPERLLNLCGAYVLAIIFGFIISTLGEYGLQSIGMKTLKNIRSQIFQHVMKQGQSFFDQRTTGALMTRTTNDVEAIYESIAWGGVGLLKDALAIIAILAMMLVLDWRLTIVSFCFAPLIVYVVNLFRRNIRRLFSEIRQLLSVLNGFFAEQIHGMTELQLHGGRDASINRFERQAKAYLELYKTANWWDAGLYSIMDGMSALAVGLMLITAAHIFDLGDASITVGLVVAFIDYLTRVFVPIRDFSGKFAGIQRALTALERIFDLLDTNSEISAGDVELDHAEPSISISNVSFRYRPDSELALDDISFRVDKGEVVALVGETGSGKTTIGKLIMRQYDGFDGSIAVGGHSIETLQGQSLKNAISMVHQDPYIFDGTIEGNITLWSTQIDSTALERAIKGARVDQLLGKMDSGLLHHVTERGRNLSAGERQLISIARALARPSPIVILDEATANVDSATEKLIDDALSELFQQKTMIVIAHRLSTIMKADRIVVMKKGKLVEQGKHDELMQANGYYAHLVERGLTRQPAAESRPDDDGT